MNSSSSHGEANTASNSTAAAARMADPDRLLADWRSLLHEQHHLHPPEAARMLGVSEEALVACRINSGATRLQGPVDRLLKPIARWGRVLCAFSNDCGVHMPIATVNAVVDDELLQLEGEQLRAAVDPTIIARAYLFIDRDDSHGNTRSLQFFDAAGASVFKVFMFHKSRFSAAEQHLLGFAAAGQERHTQPGQLRPGGFSARALSLREDPDEESLGTHVKAEVAALLSTPGPAEIELVGESIRVCWQGNVKGAGIDETMFHIHELDLRSHLRYAPVTGLARSRQGALVLNGRQGRLLRIARGVSQ